MNISVYFFKDVEKMLLSMELPSYPTFKVGDEISLEITNKFSGTWNVEPINNTFIIKKIEHKFTKHYNGKTIDNITSAAFLFVYVEETWK